LIISYIKFYKSLKCWAEMLRTGRFFSLCRGPFADIGCP